MGFLSRWQYYIQELGIVLIQPNVRGSTGFGKTFVTLDNGFKREDSVKDIGALLSNAGSHSGPAAAAGPAATAAPVAAAEARK